VSAGSRRRGNLYWTTASKRAAQWCTVETDRTAPINWKWGAWGAEVVVRATSEALGDPRRFRYARRERMFST